jgi:hypothetical protein
MAASWLGSLELVCFQTLLLRALWLSQQLIVDAGTSRAEDRGVLHVQYTIFRIRPSHQSGCCHGGKLFYTIVPNSTSHQHTSRHYCAQGQGTL